MARHVLKLNGARGTGHVYVDPHTIEVVGPNVHCPSETVIVTEHPITLLVTQSPDEVNDLIAKSYDTMEVVTS